jgi:hypothetical protein
LSGVFLIARLSDYRSFNVAVIRGKEVDIQGQLLVMTLND